MAMQTYLATAGRDKIGFTVTGRDAEAGRNTCAASAARWSAT